MGEQTGIEWTDATFNPWWGCERVSPGCAHCYADTFARRIGMSDLWQKRGEHGFRFFGDKHWAEPEKWARTLPGKLGRRPRVFCASMADVFEDKPELVTPRHRLFQMIHGTPELDWLILTKRPEFASRWVEDLYDCPCVFPDFCGYCTEWPLPNVWLGVSIENARHAYRADVLKTIPAAVRFISAEPLLGSLLEDDRPRVVSTDLGLGPCVLGHVAKQTLELDGIDWVIVGGESGQFARPMRLDWARELVDACRASGVACFVKQLGEHAARDLGLRDRKGGNPSEWPADLRVREMPR